MNHWVTVERFTADHQADLRRDAAIAARAGTGGRAPIGHRIQLLVRDGWARLGRHPHRLSVGARARSMVRAIATRVSAA
jgi:hypothetical protein